MEERGFIASEFMATAKLLEKLATEATEAIERASKLMTSRLEAGSKILVFGNGGSAADAQHFAAELIGRYRRERNAIPAVALTTDTSLITAVGNDYSFNEIFSRQVEALAQAGDIVLGISTSGRSENVIAGLRAAKQRRAYTIAMVGEEAGPAARVADEVISVPSRDTARIQEAHAIIIHILSDLIEQKMMEH